jgi:hypothetical protein
MIEIMELKTYTEYSTLPPTLTCIVDPEVSRAERERERDAPRTMNEWDRRGTRQLGASRYTLQYSSFASNTAPHTY